MPLLDGTRSAMGREKANSVDDISSPSALMEGTLPPFSSSWGVSALTKTVTVGWALYTSAPLPQFSQLKDAMRPLAARRSPLIVHVRVYMNYANPSPVARRPSPVTRHPSPVTRHPSPVTLP